MKLFASLLFVFSLCCQAQQSTPANTLPAFNASSFAAETSPLNRDASVTKGDLFLVPATPATVLENWAVFSLVVTPEGGSDNIVILDSNGNKDFASYMINSLKRWRWDPALRQGKAVAQHFGPVSFSTFVDQQGGRRSFIKAYDAVSAALASGDMDAAASGLEKLEKDQHQDMWAAAWLGWLKYGYLRAKPGSDELDLISSLQRAVMSTDSQADYKHKSSPSLAPLALNVDHYNMKSSDRQLTPLLTPEYHVSALTALFIVRLKASHFAAAVAAYEQLRELRENAAFSELQENINTTLQQFEPGYLAAQSALNSSQPLQSRGKTEASGYWWMKLSRSSFQVVPAEGTLEAIELRCEAHFSRNEFEAGQVGLRSGEWGDCDLYVQGEPGATFSVVQN